MNRRVLTVAAALIAASSLAGCARRHPDPASSPTEGAAPAPPPAAEPAPAAPSSLHADDGSESDRSARSPISAEESALSRDLDDAIAEFERAKAELEGAFRQSSNATSSGDAPKSAPAPARSGASGAPRAQAESKDRAEKKGAETSCQTACRAFASLERAAESVCRLAGPEDGRCTRAREIVTAHASRVASCGCRPDER
jgi:hypothetical protein